MFGFLGVICAFAPAVLGADWTPGLKIRYGVSGYGNTSFVDLPQNLTAAKARNWTAVTRPKGPVEYEGASIKMWCPKTQYDLCVMFDDTEYACGVLVGIDQNTTTNPKFDLASEGFYNWTVNVNGETRNYWTTQAFFVSTAALATDKASRIASRNTSQFLQEPNLYVTGIGGKLDNISTNPDIFKNSIFKQHNCIASMGNHYYYNITASLECVSTNMYPWFILENQNSMVGLGMVTYAKRVVPNSLFDWLEEYGRIILEIILKEGPECLYELGDSPGLVIMHLFFVNNPEDITC